MLNYYASILFLMVMSIDRYLAINHAMNSVANKFRSVRAVRLVSIVIWAVCLSAVAHILWTAHVLPCNICAIKFTYDYQQNESGKYTLCCIMHKTRVGKQDLPERRGNTFLALRNMLNKSEEF